MAQGRNSSTKKNQTTAFSSTLALKGYMEKITTDVEKLAIYETLDLLSFLGWLLLMLYICAEFVLDEWKSFNACFFAWLTLIECLLLPVRKEAYVTLPLTSYQPALNTSHFRHCIKILPFLLLRKVSNSEKLPIYVHVYCVILFELWLRIRWQNYS